MGNQGHATEGSRLTNEWIQAGIIGEVREVHVWSDRAGRLWKQGIPRPTETVPVPPNLDWNLWLGPIQERPYHPAYCPTLWRGWWDFGTGAMGDMGCHIIDHPVWALNLGAPTSVEARATLDGSFLEENKPNYETYPVAAIIYYEFPARGELPPVRMTWYEGGLMPATPARMPTGERLPDNGVLYVGSKGHMYHSSHGGMPQLLPRELHEAAAESPPDDAPLRRPLRRMGRCLQRRTGRRVKLRLRRPDDRNRPARRPVAPRPRHPARMGQRESESHQRPGTESVRAHGVPRRIFVVAKAESRKRRADRVAAKPGITSCADS
jgi:predicted dehydrogenase